MPFYSIILNDILLKGKSLETNQEEKKMIVKKFGHCYVDDIAFGHHMVEPPLSGDGLHTHEMCEIYCVFKGSGRYIIEGSEHKLEKGKLILMCPGEFHRAQLEQEIYESFVIHFLPEIVDSFDPERKLLRPFFDRALGKNNVYSRHNAANTAIYELFKRMDEFRGDNYDNGVKVKALLFPVLMELNSLFDAKLYEDVAVKNKQASEISEYINSHLTEALSIEKLCTKFFISRTQLNRKFKEATGTSVWEYVTAKRLMMARSMILGGTGSVEAAASSGFGDYSAFYRAYTKKYGVKPSDKTDTIKYNLKEEML